MRTLKLVRNIFFSSQKVSKEVAARSFISQAGMDVCEKCCKFIVTSEYKAEAIRLSGHIYYNRTNDLRMLSFRNYDDMIVAIKTEFKQNNCECSVSES